MMNWGLASRVNSCCKMCLSVQYCMRNTISRNKKLLLCREYNVFTKSSEFYPLLKVPQHNNQFLFQEEWKQNNELKPKYLVPLDFKLYSKDVTTPVAEEDELDPKKKLSTYAKLKIMFKKYWYVIIPVHCITSAMWFGSFYYLAASGVDIPGTMESLGVPDSWIAKVNTKSGSFVIAYGLYKLATPARYALTLGGATFSVKYLKRWGWIKPMPNKTQLKKMYQDKKDSFNDLKSNYQDKMQVTKNEFLKTKNEMKHQLKEAKEELENSIKGSKQDLKELLQEGASDLRLLQKSLKGSIQKDWQQISGRKK